MYLLHNGYSDWLRMKAADSSLKSFYYSNSSMLKYCCKLSSFLPFPQISRNWPL